MRDRYTLIHVDHFYDFLVRIQKESDILWMDKERPTSIGTINSVPTADNANGYIALCTYHTGEVVAFGLGPSRGGNVALGIGRVGERVDNETFIKKLPPKPGFVRKGG